MTEHWQAYDPAVKPPHELDKRPRRTVYRTRIDPLSGDEREVKLRVPKYPRLRAGESAVLGAYLDETGLDNIDRLRTGVPVGEGEVGGIPENKSQEQKKALSQWKIDAVVDRPGRQEIIELKSRATHTAVGQALAYDVALGERPDEPTESRPVVAAFRVHPDLPAFARLVNVQLHTVPQADRSTATERNLRDRGLLED